MSAQPVQGAVTPPVNYCYQVAKLIVIAVSTIAIIGGILGLLAPHVSSLNAFRAIGVNFSIATLVCGVVALTFLYVCRSKEGKALQSKEDESLQKGTPASAPPPPRIRLDTLVIPVNKDAVGFYTIIKGTERKAVLAKVQSELGIVDLDAHLKQLYKVKCDFQIPKACTDAELEVFLRLILRENVRYLTLEDMHTETRNLGILRYEYNVILFVRMNLDPSTPKEGTISACMAWDIARMKKEDISWWMLYSIAQIVNYLDSVENGGGLASFYLQQDIPFQKEFVESLSTVRLNLFIKERDLNIQRLDSDGVRHLTESQLCDEVLDWNLVEPNSALHARLKHLPEPKRSPILTRYPHLNV